MSTMNSRRMRHRTGTAPGRHAFCIGVVLGLALAVSGCAQRQEAAAVPGAPASATAWGDAPAASTPTSAGAALPASTPRTQGPQVCVPEYGACDIARSACCDGFICVGRKDSICVSKR